jgi:GDP-mannose 6-dehydrogenase
LGHRVTGVDRDEFKVRAVSDGHSPFFEPGLAEVITEAAGKGRLSATLSSAEALADAELVMICVGTPSAPNGDVDLSQLRRVSVEIGEALARLMPRPRRLPVAVRSTVFPGTCSDVVLPCFGGAPVSVVAHPEFLREGNAVHDFMEPPLLVVGGNDPDAVQEVARVYTGLNVRPSIVSLGTAELIKYACNLFHSVKIGFANEIGTLCQRLHVPTDEMMEVFCSDRALNISTAYLKPGFAFGGSCLPKDIAALVYRAARMNITLPLTEAVQASNYEHLRRAVQAVLDFPAERLGVFGLAFKANTDDVRESPIVLLLEHLLAKGRLVRVFDPHIQLDRIYGSNKRYLMATLPHIGKLLDSDLSETLHWAKGLVVAQPPATPFRDLIQASDLPVLDLTTIGSMLSPLSLRRT